MPFRTNRSDGPELLEARHGARLRTVLVALGLCVAILGGGGWVVRKQVQALHVHEQEELSTIAELKARQIAAWHADRCHQAERILRNRILQAQLGRLLAGQATVPQRADLQAWMNDLQADDYHQILLYDPEGRVMLQAPAGDASRSRASGNADLETALGSRGILSQQLHRDATDPRIHLSLWVPVGPWRAGRASGALLLQVDMSPVLSPIVESWPTGAKSAEALLVGRSGDEAVVLTDPSDPARPARHLPIPGHEEELLARAALGQEGLVSGRDHRGVPVLASIRKVAGTPWVMVAQVDEGEVYRQARREGWVGGLLLVGMSALVVAATGFLLRQRQLQDFRRRLDLERRARFATERYRQLMDQASEIILVLDLEGRILEANSQAIEQYGYSREQLLAMSVADLRLPETLEALSSQLATVRSGESLRFETFHRRRDGSVFPVEVATRTVSVDERVWVLSFIRDITVRRRQEQENQRITRLYGALSQVNEGIVRSRDRESLLVRICDVLVEVGGFAMAWIGWTDPQTGVVKVAAQRGDQAGYLEAIEIRTDESPLARGPVGTAIREDRACVINDFLGTPEGAPWYEAARRSGFAAVAALPIHLSGVVEGVLAVYATERDFFGSHEISLLTEAAMDVSFGLEHLAVEAQRRQAEASLRESEQFLREAEEAGGVGCYTWDILGNRWTGTPQLDRIFGVEATHPRDLSGWLDLVEPGHRQALQDYVAGLVDTGGRFDFEYPIRRPSDGEVRWLHGLGELRRDAAGRPLALVGVIRDATEWKAHQRELERLNRLYEALSQVNQAIVRSRDRRELLVRICEAMVVHGRFSMAWFGWDDSATHEVAVIASHGDELGYLDGIRIRSDATPEGQGPTGRAIREGRAIVVNDFMAYPGTGPWREKARNSGYAASASLPIRLDGGVVGALTVYASDVGFFGARESALLEEAADDVSFALDHLAGELRRREAEEALRHQKEEFETIFNRVPTQIWYKDTHNRCLRVNEKVCQDLGMSRDRIEGHTAEELFPEFAEAYYRDDQEVLTSGRPKLGILEQIGTTDGRRLWLRTDKVPVLDAAGRASGILAIVEDLTYWRQAEESLHTVYTAMEQAPVAVLITDVTGAIQYVNPAFTRITGYNFEEVLGRNPRLLGSGRHPRAFFQEMWDTLAAGRVWAGEILNRRKDGAEFTAMSTLSPVRDSSGSVIRFVAIQEDITERKRAEEARRELEAQMQQAQKLESLGSLAGGLAHDMNNVLGAILGLASTLREKSGGVGPDGKALDTIIQACMRGRGVVKSMLYFARKDLQEERPVDLNDLVQEMVQLLGHTTLSRVRIVTGLEQGLPQVRGDGGALSHALMNLCVNALDAMPEGGELRVTTALAPDGGVELRVRDTGGGMPPEVLARCREPFYTTKARGKGTGLGIPMVHNTMVAHEGRLDLESAPGKGTEAVLVFPPARVLAATQPQVPPEAVGSPVQTSLAILLVDDDDLVRESVSELLGLLGHQGTCVSSGEEALALLGRGMRVDLVILDMNMPGLSGAQVLPRILALRPGLPVILATGYSQDDLAPLLAGRSHVQALSKPFSAPELRAAIAQFARLWGEPGSGGD